MLKKTNLLMKELRKFGIDIAGLSETKWFDSNIYSTEGYTILSSGRPLPKDGEHMHRGEGVGIALGKRATEAWVAGGQVWEPVSSRVMSARLLVGGEGCKAQYVQFISVYAPTFAAKQAVKEHFFAHLQGVLDRTATNDILVIVGGFNARVGSRTGDIDLCTGHVWSR